MTIFLKYDGKERELNLPTKWEELDVVNAIGVLQALCMGLSKPKLQAEILSILLPVPNSVLVAIPDEQFGTLMYLVEELTTAPKQSLECLSTLGIGDASYFVPMPLCANFTTAQMATVDSFMKEQPLNTSKVCAAIVQSKMGEWDEYESKALEKSFATTLQPWQALYLIGITAWGFKEIGKLYPSKGGANNGWLSFMFALAEQGSFGDFKSVTHSNALAVVAFGDYLQNKPA